MALSCVSPFEDLELMATSCANLYQGTALGRPKGQWQKPESLCQQDKRSTLKPKMMLILRAPLKRTVTILSDSEDPSSSDDYSQFHIRKPTWQASPRESTVFHHLPLVSFYAVVSNPHTSHKVYFHGIHLFGVSTSVSNQDALVKSTDFAKTQLKGLMFSRPWQWQTLLSFYFGYLQEDHTVLLFS